MMEHLPEDLRRGLAEAARRDARRRSRLRIRVGGQEFPVLRLWEDGFALKREHGQGLRGLVDLYDGSRHLSQCLIVASAEDGDTVHCKYKRSTAATDRAPRDFAAEEGAPAGLLPRP
ncbi:MAG: hypothetical protein KJZ85_07280 [Rhodobacteraceae bacterium]|jgi:hypothetical protein|nr:hypothetical protein [Paracoccaceae bacterium]